MKSFKYCISFTACTMVVVFLGSCTTIATKRSRDIAPLSVDCSGAGLHEPEGGLPSLSQVGWSWHGSIIAPDVKGLAWGGGHFAAVGQNKLTSHSKSGWDFQHGGATVRNSSPYALFDGFQDACWVGNGFFTVGTGGQARWFKAGGGSSSRRDMGTDLDLYSVAWSGERTVAVGQGGTIRVSDNTSRWTQADYNDEGQDLINVSWTGREFLAMGNSGYLLRSLDGSCWSVLSQPSEDTLTGFATDCVTNVVVSTSGDILRSSDGKEWELAFHSETALHDIAWTGSEFIAVGNSGAIVCSESGTDWTMSESGVGFDLYCISVGAAIVAAGAQGGRVFSIDGRNWYERPPITVDDYSDISWWKGRFIAIAKRGVVFASQDGSSWSQNAMLPYGGGYFKSLVGSDQLLIAGGCARKNNKYIWAVHLSNDGVQWADTGIDITGQLRAAHWTGNEFVLGGQNGEIMRSADGVKWERDSLGVRNTVIGIASSPDLLLAVLSNGLVATKRAAEPWEVSEIPASGRIGIMDVLWDGRQFVVLANPGLILVSSDGLDWIAIAENLEPGHYSIHYNSLGYFQCGTSILWLSWYDRG